MALKDIITHRRTINGPGGTTFEVGALDLSIVVELFATRKNEAKALFDAAEGEGITTNPDPLAIALLMLKLAPDFVADAVALAANEPESAAVVRKLPVGVQLEAIDAIIELTFEAEGGVKKLGEIVVRLMRRSTEAFEEVRLTN